jgi:succinate-semialdehyde dehydrogenase/glutarate-semialdehyde dehydrogenase
VFEPFREKFVEALGDLKVGDPMDESTDLGPVAKKEILETLGRQLNDALKKGARAHYGPKPPNRGYFFQPVVLAQLTADMLVLRDEVFGPIAPVITVRNEQDMIRTANSTEFGLGAAIWRTLRRGSSKKAT